MNHQERIDASIARIGAQRIAGNISIAIAKGMEGIAGSGAGGIDLSHAWIEEADDDKLDAVIAHEILHQAFGAKRAEIAPLISDLKVDGMGARLTIDAFATNKVGEILDLTSTPILDERPTYPGTESWRTIGDIANDVVNGLKPN